MSGFTLAGQVLRWTWTHPANRRRRLRSAARAVAFQARGRLGGRTMAIVGERARMWAAPHETAASKVVYANPPDWNEMRAWRRILRPGDLFVDIGSNVGSYALWAADAGANVIAVEPSPATAARLRENVALNTLPIVVRECALAAEPGRMRLSVGHGSMNHLLIASAATGDEVEVDTLDNLLGDRYAAGVKIDVEGAERLVLEGAERALSQRRIGVLQVEWNEMSERVLAESRSPAAKILLAHGYSFMRPDADGVLREADPWPSTAEDIFAVAPS